jgi:hypothetical protein
VGASSVRCASSAIKWVPDDAGRHAILEGLNELPDFCLNPAQFALTGGDAGTCRHPETIHLAREFMAEVFEQVASKQLLLQRVENPPLDLVSPDRQMIRTGPFVASPETRKAMSRLEDEATSADPHFVSPENRY